MTSAARDYSMLVRYLLGELPEHEQETVEERYMLDEEYSQLRDQVEMDLVDAYVCGTMTSKQRLDFEAHYAITPERRESVRAARLLKGYREGVAQRTADPSPSRWSLWAQMLARPRSLMASAALVLAVTAAGIGGWLVFRGGRETNRESQNASSTPRTPAKQVSPIEDHGRIETVVGSAAKHPEAAAPGSRETAKPGATLEPGPRSLAQTAGPPAPQTANGIEPSPNASFVGSVIELAKSGMSDALILRTIHRTIHETARLTSEDTARLRSAGVSEGIIAAMMNASGAPATSMPTTSVTAPVQVPSAAAVSPTREVVAVGQPCAIPAAVTAVPTAVKPRVAIAAFEYGAVKTAVTAVAGNDVNIGEGIRAMLMARMSQSGTTVPLQREKIKDALAEQDFGTSNRVKQGTQAKVGQLKGADAMLYGTIVTFGRDDKAKKNGAGAALRYIPGIGGLAAGAANAKETDKAVVVINLRLVDAATLEVIDAEEARGESTRTSTNWAAVAGTWRGGAGADSGMTSKDFGETIIGEATQDAVNKIAAILEQKMGGVSAKSRTIEGRVANFDGCTLILSVGANDGVQVGDHFEIHKILSGIIDPETKEVLDKQTVKVGDFVASTVRDKVTIGQYGGEPLSSTYAKGYAARLVNQ